MTRRISAILFATLVAMLAPGCGEQSTSPANGDSLLKQPPDTTGTGETPQRDWFAYSVVYVPDSAFVGETVAVRHFRRPSEASDTSRYEVLFAKSHGYWYVQKDFRNLPPERMFWFRAGTELRVALHDSTDSSIETLGALASARGDELAQLPIQADLFSVDVWEAPGSFQPDTYPFLNAVDYYADRRDLIRAVMPMAPPQED